MPFEGRCEYSKSNRASCQKCKEKIPKDEFRIARLVRNPKFDGVQPKWYHFDCFWAWKGSSAAGSTADFEGFDSVRIDDQKRLEAKLTAGGGGGAATGKMKQKKGVVVQIPRLMGCPGLKCEYAKSSRSSCRMCEEKIAQGEVRLALERPMDDRPNIMVPKWFHRRCFMEGIQTEKYNDVPLEFIMPQHFEGWEELEKAELKDLSLLFDTGRESAGFGKLGMTGPKKTKRVSEEEVASAAKKAKVDTKMEAQSRRQWSIRDAISDIDNSFLKDVLSKNKLSDRGGDDALRQRVADGMLFGALRACPECKTNSWDVKNDGFHCKGHIDEYSACVYVTQTPPVKSFKLSPELAPLLKKFLPATPVTRLFREEIQPKKRKADSGGGGGAAASPANKKAASGGGGGAAAAAGGGGGAARKSGLDGRLVAITGKLKRSEEDVAKILEGILGAKLYKGKIGSHVSLLVSTDGEVAANKLARVKSALEFGVPIVSEAWLTDCEKAKGYALAEPHVIACNTTFVEPGLEAARVATKQEQHRSGITDSTRRGSVEATTTRLKKGRTFVEPASGRTESHHVLDEGHTVWEAKMTNVNLRDNMNSYYTMQILQLDNGRGAELFRAWGRVGTKAGGTKCERLPLVIAKQQFEDLFYTKTGNTWGNRNSFTKQPAMFDFQVTTYDAIGATASGVVAGSTTKLPVETQQLMQLLFDEKMLEHSLKEMEIDVSKMPLGAISRVGMQEAFASLGMLQKVLEDESLDEEARDRAIMQHTTKFYFKVPHDFGMRAPPMIDNLDLLRSKIELVQNLMEIELASRMLKRKPKAEGDDGDAGEDEDPMDTHYKSLNSKIKPVSRGSEDFALVEKYLQNTHATTHNQYELELVNVFKVVRKGEKVAYNKKSASMHNKRLLWHGSRLSNYCGILGEGLRIAPPSAPTTGYMFGKGVYFADMVSKSANYCFASKQAPSGLLLLSEVALGNMYECTGAEYVEKLPDGKHSTFGIGKTMPDKSDAHITDDGVQVPFGKGVKSGVPKSDLLYNEYIVYDTAQIRQKYLLQVNFKFGSRRGY